MGEGAGKSAPAEGLDYLDDISFDEPHFPMPTPRHDRAIDLDRHAPAAEALGLEQLAFGDRHERGV